MLSGKVTEYVRENSIGNEYLFKDWESFLYLLYSEGGRISSIQWWDHCRSAELSSSVGSGGYKDPENPEYIYAETHLFKDGLEENTYEEIREYIMREQRTGLRYGSEYYNHELIPSFYPVE